MVRFFDESAFPLPSRLLLTDDPFRVKMMVAHHLDNAHLASEQRGLLCYTGSFNNSDVAVMSVGFGGASLQCCLNEAAQNGVESAIYLGECVAFDSSLALGSVLIASEASNGTNNVESDGILQGKSIFRAGQLGIPVRRLNVLTNDRFWLQPLQQSPAYKVADFASYYMYTCPGCEQMQKLSILTVSEQTSPPQKMDEAERQSRFHKAVRLAFETISG